MRSNGELRHLEYKDAKDIISFVHNNDIYDEEAYLFAVDIDILNTTELDIRNSLFKYQMMGVARYDSEQQIEKILLIQSNSKLRQNKIVRLELLSIDCEIFTEKALSFLIRKLDKDDINKIKLNIMRRQLNDKVVNILHKWNAVEEAVYKAKDDDVERDCITYAIIL